MLLFPPSPSPFGSELLGDSQNMHGCFEAGLDHLFEAQGSFGVCHLVPS